MAEDPTKLIPTSVYQGLGVGPEFSRSYENQQSVPIDGSNQQGRVYSPFTIRVVPPLIYTEFLQKFFQGKNTKSSQDFIGTATLGFDGYQETKQYRFQKARMLGVSQIGGNRASDNRTPEEYVDSSGRKKSSNNNSRANPTLSDQNVAIDIASQLEAILSVPPLTLLINPTSLQIQRRKIQQFTERTRSSYIFQTWGDEQPVLSISGKVGAFIAGLPSGLELPNGAPTPVPTGVQFASKNDSAAWQHFQTLFLFYKHNGYIHDVLGQSNAMHAVGRLAIEYDKNVWLGNMNSFSYGFEDETNQHGGIQFDIEFTVNEEYDTDTPISAIQPLNSPTAGPTSNFFVQAGRRAAAGILDFVGGDSDPDEEIIQPAGDLLVTGEQITLDSGTTTSDTNAGGTSEVETNDNGFDFSGDVGLDTTNIDATALPGGGFDFGG